MNQPSRGLAPFLGFWAFFCYLAAVCFSLRLVWEALAGPDGGQLTTAIGAVLCAVSGTVYLFCALRSER